MSKHLRTPTKLTEFGPLQIPDESKSPSVTQFITNFFWKKSEESASASSSKSDVVTDSLPTWASDSTPDNAYKVPESNVYDVDINEGRSLPNVLKRISNLLALKSSNLQDYSDTELKQYWMPDSVSRECYECSEKFTTFRRRHHCRVCGQIFCSQCCNQQIPGKIFGCTGELRVCTYCCKIVLSYLQSSDFNAVLSNDLKLLQESLQSKFGPVASKSLDDKIHTSSDGTDDIVKRKISVGYQEEKFFNENKKVTYLTSEEKCRALQNSASLRSLYEEMVKPSSGLFDTHRYKLKTYTDCFLGSELVDWLICQQKAKNRVQASTICQALLEGGYIESLSEPSSFIDGYVFYHKKLVSLSYTDADTRINFDNEEPHWVQQIHESNTDSDNEPTIIPSSSSYTLDLNLEANTVYLSKPFDYQYHKEEQEKEEVVIVRPSDQLEVLAPESGWFNATNLREENGEKLAYTVLTHSFEQLQSNLLKQLLTNKNLSYNWSEIIIPLLRELITIIRPDKNHDAIDLDIRHYIQFKVLSSGLKADTCLVKGIVCSKNIAHIDMSKDINNPRILLLQCAIVYQRTEGRLMSLEPVLMQEYEYLRNVAARIVALKPNIVLVHKNVSRIAQEMLRQHDITLVRNVKQSILERLSRCTQADIVSAVDAHIGRPKLGTCKRFYLKNYIIDKDQTKTLMFFEGLPAPHLGATVLLRGGSDAELSKLKEVSVMMLFALYGWRLEKSFLMDEFAMPPNADDFLEDSKESSPIEEQKVTESVGKKIDRVAVLKRFEQSTDNKTLVEDFTDPLHSSNIDYTKSNETLYVAQLPFSNNFKKHLDDTILCTSPYIVIPPPFLESEAGKKCQLRRYFPEELYYSAQFINQSKYKWRNVDSDGNEQNTTKSSTNIKELHPFLTTKLTKSAEDTSVQNLLANFRACGGRFVKKDSLCIKNDSDEVKDTKVDKNDCKDVLDPANHQRLAVLFCSYSTESNNAPAFCVNPWIVYMDFFGRNDIPLGCFLERYCFRTTYECPSKSCDTPMISHIRRFVHYNGCVTICLNYFDNEFSDEQIVMWTWCTRCQKVSPIVPMSADSWSYPFAKYLEMKFYGDFYTRRGLNSCEHSLHHEHYQYFGYKSYVATFKYNPINIWEISLPPIAIEIKYDYSKQHNSFIDEIKSVAQKGHDIYQLIGDKLKLDDNDALKQLLIKEQTQFKQLVDEIQIKVTSPSVESKPLIDELQVRSIYWGINDSIVKLKMYLVDNVEQWNERLNEISNKKKDDKKKDSKSEESGEFVDEDVKSDRVLSEGEDSTDNKKERSVKNILSNLLQSTNNSCLIQPAFSSNEHYLSDSWIPLVVLEDEPSSIVAYTLCSNEYKRLLDELSRKNDLSVSPSQKRKSTSDKSDDEKEKKNVLGFLKTKSDANVTDSTESVLNADLQEDAKKVRKTHVEVQFQDGNSNFFCRVYLAEKFAALRASLLPMGEEGYIRSLSRSVQWNARGGKSGSTFAKTVDDRFILKEMSKTEVHLFLESSSNYFSYMNKCQATKQLTLLGKILGIYQIVYKNSSNVPYRSNILVMENLFYNRKVTQKFDLKGSMRNRLVVPDNQSEEIVLLDENLMKMTCESPLYVLPHSKTILINAILSDTEFLSMQSVMDYSLLVGLDSDNKEIVLGIIDYIRTFTWDKRLETMVKKSGILGGQGKLPTIISPEEYQKRFIDAMHKYFLEVPDHWAGLEKNVDL